MRYYLFIFFFSLVFSVASAQSVPRETSKDNRASQVDRGATYSMDQKKTKKKKSKHSVTKHLDKKVEEYEKRMQANAKKYAKMAKEMKKPQYSDPSYFGHKKKPKKRPPGKKKFCKECQLVH